LPLRISLKSVNSELPIARVLRRIGRPSRLSKLQPEIYPVILAKDYSFLRSSLARWETAKPASSGLFAVSTREHPIPNPDTPRFSILPKSKTSNKNLWRDTCHIDSSQLRL
jgi:hypothetical protein